MNRQLLVPETHLSKRETRVDLENVQNTDIDVEGMKKRIIWKKEEDELLAKSYVILSDDPIIGNDQKENDSWRRVASYYNDNRPAGSCRRALKVIRSHWYDTIQKRVGASNTSLNKDASVDLDINEEEIRLIGQKAAKRKGKNKAKSSMEDMTRYDSMFESFTQYTDIKKNESEWKQKELAIEEMKAKAALKKSEAKKSKYLLKEYKILSKDTSQMTPKQLIVHEHM
ncbi:uncharacterized protein [Primulina eburnea]|uniref:uncharacterized protein n=1 Tax=Primulina eburnea TaxID=1245227 RepID=UPI003C6CA746